LLKLKNKNVKKLISTRKNQRTPETFILQEINIFKNHKASSSGAGSERTRIFLLSNYTDFLDYHNFNVFFLT